MRKLILPALALVLAGPGRLLACSVCFGEPESPMAQGLSWAIAALAGMIAFVLAGVVLFFVHVGRNAAALAAGKPVSPTQPRS